MKKITCVKLLIMSLFLLGKGASAQIPSNGLIGYFPFTGNANDQNGNGINGTPSSGGWPGNTFPALTADRNGNANSAYDFVPASLSTTFIDFGQPSQFNFGTNSFSISLWMKLTVFQVSPTMFANDAWQLGIRNLGGNNHLKFTFGTLSFNSDMLIIPGTWTNVVAVYNHSNETMEMYINGALATGFSYNGGPIGPQGQASLSTAGLGLNATPVGTSQAGLAGVITATGFKGVLDDILIYNRALSASEVNGIYTATGSPSTINEKSKDNSFLVSPNPSNGIFKIQFIDKNEKDATYKVYTLQGKLIWEEIAPTDQHNIDCSWLETGNYLLKIENSKGIFTKKIIVNK
ncbi:MAG: T9SS type A sorting domain-containing protein [Bacteroidetes bacterium]|nr:T9SS type A sorting domain-containing protein [Bacteroidota bacterium]